MPSGPDPVPIGSLTIDCTSMASFLQDAAPGALIGKLPTQDGFSEASLEILSNQAQYGGDVGITANDINALEQANAHIEAIDAVLPAARKLVEVLEESRHLIDNGRHRQISELAALVDARSKARGTPELLARYQKTREYRSAIGRRAAATRRNNLRAAIPDLGAIETPTIPAPPDPPNPVAPPAPE